ncbi:MAG: tetratricopeptide repeat protein [Cyanobacteriota bacterium]|nr:tetratricopeptide repeat protein [Cyanobacteriota bacterium]
MPKFKFFISLPIALAVWGISQPARGQALVPHSLQLNAGQLEEIGESLVLEANQWAQFQQFEYALPRAKLAAQLLPDSAEAWAILGSLHLQMEEASAAIAALEKARELTPENATILFALGSAHFQNQDYERAALELEAGLELAPDTVGALFDLGNAHYLMGNLSEAIARYEEAIELDAQFWPATNNMGLVKYEQGDVDAAMDLWREAVEVENAAEPQLALAVALYTLGKLEEGLELGEQAIGIDLRYAELDFLKANLWGDRLLGDAAVFLQTPRIQSTIAQANEEPTIDVHLGPR